MPSKSKRNRTTFVIPVSGINLVIRPSCLKRSVVTRLGLTGTHGFHVPHSELRYFSDSRRGPKSGVLSGEGLGSFPDTTQSLHGRVVDPRNR